MAGNGFGSIWIGYGLLLRGMIWAYFVQTTSWYRTENQGFKIRSMKKVQLEDMRKPA